MPAPPSERLAVLRDRHARGETQPADHAEALDLCREVMDDLTAKTKRLAELDGWHDLVAANRAALRAAEAHLSAMHALKLREVEAVEKRAAAMDRLTGSRWFWPTIVLLVLLAGGYVGVFTFSTIDLQIPGITAPVSEAVPTEALDAPPHAETDHDPGP